MHDIGSDINFGRETIKQQQEHHDDAARSSDQAYQDHSRESLHRRRTVGDTLFDPPLKQHEEWNDDQQNANGTLDEVVDSIPIEVTDMHEELNATDGAWDASQTERDYDVAPDRALFQMHKAGGNFGKEVE